MNREAALKTAFIDAHPSRKATYSAQGRPVLGNGKPAPPFSGREIVQAVAAIHPRLREIRFFNTLLGATMMILMP